MLSSTVWPFDTLNVQSGLPQAPAVHSVPICLCWWYVCVCVGSCCFVYVCVCICESPYSTCSVSLNPHIWASWQKGTAAAVLVYELSSQMLILMFRSRCIWRVTAASGSSSSSGGSPCTPGSVDWIGAHASVPMGYFPQDSSDFNKPRQKIRRVKQGRAKGFQIKKITNPVTKNLNLAKNVSIYQKVSILTFGHWTLVNKLSVANTTYFVPTLHSAIVAAADGAGCNNSYLCPCFLSICHISPLSLIFPTPQHYSSTFSISWHLTLPIWMLLF